MPPPVTAVYDANILYSAPLRDLFIRVTFNLRDFPAVVLAAFDIEAQHPDDFLMGLLDVAPGAVCAAVKRQRESLRNPPKTVEELLGTLESQGLTQSVGRLRQFADLL